jgi:hypothetical protein
MGWNVAHADFYPTRTSSEMRAVAEKRDSAPIDRIFAETLTIFVEVSFRINV